MDNEPATYPYALQEEPRPARSLVGARDRLNNIIDLTRVISVALERDTLQGSALAIVMQVYVIDELKKLKEELDNFDTF